ncbi:uncharacterized protein ACBR49_008774 [Aulostomus maculatus]
MPKSDTWPGGNGLETMTGMDSAGSCDSVVSANSTFSDDSLEHLSAEEKACIMFLEETIESLDTEEDSGLSNDEPDQLPSPGNLATRMAELSASKTKGRLNGPQKYDAMEAIKENSDTRLIQGYLVPTPFVLAGSSFSSIPKAKRSVSPEKNVSSRQNFPPSSSKSGRQHRQNQTPVEVNVPPPSKPRDYSRGPLSYDALVHLRRSASTKKTPLCPKVDHTIDLDQHPPAIMEESNPLNPSSPGQSLSEAPKPKTSPPAVAPKPKQIPAHISVKTQNEAPPSSDFSLSVKNGTDPKVVRQEALQKLGLLKGQPPDKEPVALPLPPPLPPSMAPTQNRFARGPSHTQLSRSKSSYSQVPTEPKNCPLQSSASFHHRPTCAQQSASNPCQPICLKAAGLEPSTNLDNPRNGRLCPESAESVKTASAAQPAARKASNPVGYTVMMVPGMGADRKEALRKLGLLKD